MLRWVNILSYKIRATGFSNIKMKNNVKNSLSRILIDSKVYCTGLGIGKALLESSMTDWEDKTTCLEIPLCQSRCLRIKGKDTSQGFVKLKKNVLKFSKNVFELPSSVESSLSSFSKYSIYI